MENVRVGDLIQWDARYGRLGRIAGGHRCGLRRGRFCAGGHDHPQGAADAGNEREQQQNFLCDVRHTKDKKSASRVRTAAAVRGEVQSIMAGTIEGASTFQPSDKTKLIRVECGSDW